MSRETTETEEVELLTALPDGNPSGQRMIRRMFLAIIGVSIVAMVFGLAITVLIPETPAQIANRTYSIPPTAKIEGAVRYPDRVEVTLLHDKPLGATTHEEVVQYAVAGAPYKVRGAKKELIQWTDSSQRPNELRVVGKDRFKLIQYKRK